MRALVTGAAGFIGSTLAEHLVDLGHDVIGVDAFTAYYDRATKDRNVARLRDEPAFTLVEADLADTPLDPLLDGIDAVFHQAGQPGVRASWGAGFSEYVQGNIGVTQRLLEACRHRPLQRFVAASSSSIYGDAQRFPTSEDDVPRPRSPYGVTKLAAENLCSLYGTNFGVPTVSLRYFTVFGPRQRPDMAMHMLIEAASRGTSFPVNGDGTQVRDFTYVDDVVAANILAAQADAPPGFVANIGGGSATSLLEVIDIVESLVGQPIALERLPPAAGDPARTGADTTRARTVLGWQPKTDVREGLTRQVAYQLGR